MSAPNSKFDLIALLGKHPHPKHLDYGTAGFRADATLLEEAMLRCGILAACRSHALNGQAVGAMVTASHNPPHDNGIKIVEPDGSMFSAEWEPTATAFVNAGKNHFDTLSSLVNIEDVVNKNQAVVVVGCDTRDSCPNLVSLFVTGVEAVGGKVINIDRVTTPQLHIAVCSYNQKQMVDLPTYFSDLSDAFKRLVGNKGASPFLVKNLVIDCANGVGAFSANNFKQLLEGVTIVNVPGDGPLNDQCGADFVQKKRTMPKVYGKQTDGQVWASLDGDADRLVIYQPKEGTDEFLLADGDRFAALATFFMVTHMKRANISDLSVAVAQTAYSNGAATEFIQTLNSVEVVIAKTGVKHLEKAIHPFDVGVYWEPNGHGTILFSKKATQTFQAALALLSEDKSQASTIRSLEALIAVTKLANQAVGDGVADLLLIIAMLSFEDMSIDEWIQLYDERCSCNMIVRVEDKSVIKTVDCDREVEQPTALRVAISTISSEKGCRAFVRPSGTEDVVRVYAEAPFGNEGKAKEMAKVISQAIFDHCAGVGDRP